MGVQELIQQFGAAASAVVLSQFPRKCSSCMRPIPTFVSYITSMQPIGLPHLDSIDDEDGAVGLLCFSNCACGSTIALRYEDVKRHRAFNEAVREATRISGLEEGQLLAQFVDAVNQLSRDFEASAAASPTQQAAATPAEEVDTLQLKVGAALVDMVKRGKLTIPPAPIIAMRVQQMTRDPRSRLDSIAEVIAGDPALSTEVLKVANSVMFAPGSRGTAVTSLPAAVQRIGVAELGNIAVAATLGKMTRGSGPLTALRTQLWRQSVITAILARSLGQHRRVNADEAFLSGLLSSLGAVLGTLGVEAYLASNAKFPARPMAWWRHVIELFANELGAAAAAAWSLAPMQTAVVSHAVGSSQPDDLDHEAMVELIRAASRVARLALESPVVSTAELEQVPGLAPAERTLLANELPASVQRIATLCDSGTSTPTGLSRKLVGFNATEPEASRLDRSIKVIARSLDGTSFECTALGVNELVLAGKTAIQEQTLVSLELQVQPPLTFWAAATRCESKPPGAFQIVLSPFAMNDETFRRWNTVVERG